MQLRMRKVEEKSARWTDNSRELQLKGIRNLGARKRRPELWSQWKRR